MGYTNPKRRQRDSMDRSAKKKEDRVSDKFQFTEQGGDFDNKKNHSGDKNERKREIITAK